MDQNKLQLHRSLIQAIRNHSPAQVRAILEEGADPNFLERHGSSPLMVAANYNQPAAIDILLEYGADVRAVDKLGHTALHHAFAKNESPACAQCVSKLIQAGALLDARDNIGRTPLFLAFSVDNDCNGDSSEAIHLLLDQGADLWLADQKQQTPYMLIVGIDATHSCFYEHGSVRDRIDAMALQERMEHTTPAAPKDGHRGPRL